MKNSLSNYTKSRNNNFNLMRFIAATLVLFSHSFAIISGSGDSEPLRKSLGMTWGSIAVDIFFVTSGFLIASSFFGRKNITAFIWARVLRIYPALIISIIFCVFIVGLFFTSHNTTEYFLSPITIKFFIKNIFLFYGLEYHLPGVFSNVPYKSAVNGSLWTLPIEVKMYVYLAILGSATLYLQKRYDKNILKLTFLSIGIISVAGNIINHFYSFADLHLFSMFFIGAMFNIFKNNIYLSTRIFFLFLILLLLSLINKDLFFVIYCLLIPYLILFIAYVPSGIIRIFNRVGDYSYGMYIFAFPVQQSIISIIPDVSINEMIILSFFITLTLSFLSWHLIEKRFLRLKENYLLIEIKLKKIFIHSTTN